ncbi:nitrate- and nitrite sensing domain-containing protein [Amycolatopsis sp. NPDC059027]|uniref:sensor histidine kinase n=1 Tax=Amycolatopsis sp. NPDC059027 TaxID=3346709 RepID=UPI00366D78D5
MKQNSVRRGRGSSIRSRVLTIALIPSVALLLVGVALAGYLVFDAATSREYALKIRSSETPAIPFFAALQEERRLTLGMLAGQTSQRPALTAARAKSDATAAPMADNLKQFTADSHVPDSVKQNIATFMTLYAKTPQIRQQADSGQLQLGQAFGFYNQVMDQFIDGVGALARAARGAENAFERLTAIPMFSAADEMRRSDALAAAALASGGLSQEDFRTYLGQIGAYHAQLEASTSRMIPEVRAQYDKLVASPQWQTLTTVENAFLRGDLTKLPVPQEQWRAAADQVGVTLMKLFVQQSSHATNLAIDDADDTLTNSIIGAAAALLVALAVVIVALRLSRRLIGRLARLREDTLDAAEVRLPELVERVRNGEPVDLEDGGHFLDHGTDEIGQVADAFNKAQQTAIAAAVDEAKTREGTKTVFLNIAHRSQVIVHRQLKVLDQAERKQEDPEQLDTLFQLDHLSTRARRNAENLIILGGGQPGRQWRNPVGLAELVRGASAETEDFARVKTGALPQIAVRGPVVGDLVHLLAELIDNATSFSPPQSRVEVRGNVVGKGVVIEVEDQGLGLEPEQAEQFNAMLADPPDFGIMALSDEPRLGLFVVARLAARHGINVHLRESAYGGTRAIVLVRSELLAQLPEPEEELPERGPVSEEDTPEPTEGVTVIGRPRRGKHRTEPPMPVPVPELPASERPPAPRTPSGGETAPPPLPSRTQRPVRPEPARTQHPPAWPAQEPRPAQDGRPQQPQRPAAPGRPPLPQRRRQQNLVPQLREDRAARQEREETRQDTPELARDRLAAFQQGTRRAREQEEPGIDDRYGDRE